MTRRRWPVLITPAAESDINQIVEWTAERYGDAQARAYADALSAAVDAHEDGPTVPGARQRHDLGADLYALHVGREGHKGRHFVVFRIGRDQGDDVIAVLRVLHDAMDLTRHLPKSGTDES